MLILIINYLHKLTIIIVTYSFNSDCKICYIYNIRIKSLRLCWREIVLTFDPSLLYDIIRGKTFSSKKLFHYVETIVIVSSYISKLSQALGNTLSVTGKQETAVKCKTADQPSIGTVQSCVYKAIYLLVLRSET